MLVTLYRIIAVISSFAFNFGASFVMVYYVSGLYRIFYKTVLPIEAIIVISAGLVCVGAILAFTPIGQFYESLHLPFRRLSTREGERLVPIKETLEAEYEEKIGKRLKIKLYVIDDPEPSAAAYAGNRVAVHSGLLNKYDDEVLKGAMAHEMAHIHHKDTAFYHFLQASDFSNSFVMFLISIFTAPLRILPEFIAGLIMLPILPLCFSVIVRTKLTDIIYVLAQLTSRSIEYRADRFAKRLVGESGMIRFLEDIKLLELHDDAEFMNMYTRSHPPSELRIEKLMAEAI